MERRVIAILVLGLLLLGCVDDDGAEANDTMDGLTDLKEAIDPDSRAFVYDVEREAPWPINMTIASLAGTPGDAYQVYGKTDLTIRDCLALPDEGSGKFRCLWKAAVYLKDSSICEKFDSEDYRQMCYYNYAVNAMDPSACDKAENPYIHKETCKRQTAVFLGNESLCGYHPAEPNGEEKAELCRYFTRLGTATGPECRDELVSYSLTESTHFGETIRWLSENHPGAKVLSWWDYGQALDCAGLESVISGDDLDDPNVQYTAHLFVDADESELASFMEAEGADFVMLDSELIISPGALGGKYGALNYISCAWANETDPSMLVSTSQCEKDHLWETIFVTTEACNISANKTGAKAYYLLYEDTPSGTPNPATAYPAICMDAQDSTLASYCENSFEAVPVYCVGETLLSDGDIAFAPYHLNQTNPDGSLKLNKAAMLLGMDLEGTYHFGYTTQVTLFYTMDELWLVNGTVTDGYGDRTTEFYDSVIYKALFLDSIEGFEKAYTDPSNSVRVFGPSD